MIETGRLIRGRQVVADYPAGELVGLFPGSVIWKHRHRMEIRASRVDSRNFQIHDAGSIFCVVYFHPATRLARHDPNARPCEACCEKTGMKRSMLMAQFHTSVEQLGKKHHG